VEKAFSVIDPILAITKTTDGSFMATHMVQYHHNVVAFLLLTLFTNYIMTKYNQKQMFNLACER